MSRSGRYKYSPPPPVVSEPVTPKIPTPQLPTPAPLSPPETSSYDLSPGILNRQLTETEISISAPPQIRKISAAPEPAPPPAILASSMSNLDQTLSPNNRTSIYYTPVSTPGRPESTLQKEGETAPLPTFWMDEVTVTGEPPSPLQTSGPLPKRSGCRALSAQEYLQIYNKYHNNSDKDRQYESAIQIINERLRQAATLGVRTVKYFSLASTGPYSSEIIDHVAQTYTSSGFVVTRYAGDSDHLTLTLPDSTP